MNGKNWDSWMNLCKFGFVKDISINFSLFEVHIFNSEKKLNYNALIKKSETLVLQISFMLHF